MARYKLINATHVRRLIHAEGKQVTKKGIQVLEKTLNKIIKNTCENEVKKKIDFSQKIFPF